MHTTTFKPTARSAARVARDVDSLFKLRIGVLIMITALVGMAVTPGPMPSLVQAGLLGLSVLLASASAGAFNQYAEYESDRLMQRTRSRAFASGALTHHPGWLALMAALLVLSVALAWLQFNAMAALHVFMGAFFYGVVYTLWLKRRTHWNIVIGGLAGSFAVLAGAAAIDPMPGPLPWLLALVLFLWTPPHFWSLAIANRDDYAQAGVPMLPGVVGPQRAATIGRASTCALFAASLLPLAYGAGWAYAAGALGGGAYFMYRSWRLVRSPVRAAAMGAFFASLTQLCALLAGACIDVALR